MNRRGAAAAGLLATVVVVLGTAVWLGNGSSERHADGAGELASNDGPGFEAMAVKQKPGVTSWTYGLRLCLASGSDAAVIESVAPTLSVGSGYRALGVLIREFMPTVTDTPIISVDDYPPGLDTVPDPIRDAVGFAVSTSCAGKGSDPYTELLVGLGAVGIDGGGWRGIDIAYSVAGRQRVLVLNHNLFICGPSVADDCSEPPPAT